MTLCVYIYGYDVFSHSKYWIIDVFLPILGSAQLCCVGFLLNTFMAVLLTMTKFQGWERYSVCVCVKNILVLFTVVSQLWCMFCCVLSVRLLLNKFPNKENKVVLCIVNVIQCSLENCSNVHLSYMWYNGQLPKYIRNVKTDNFHFMCYLNFKEKGCPSTKLYNALLLFCVLTMALLTVWISFF